jgi:YVTN family beta-propeller protein
MKPALPFEFRTSTRKQTEETRMKLIVLFATIFVVAGVAAAQMPSGLKLQTRYPVAGTEGWDYITVDSDARRIYVSHAVRVNVLNADTGAEVGIIEDTPGVHGIAIAPSSKHGFTSNGKEDRVSMFSTADLSLITKIEVGKGPDGIYYDTNTDRVFTNNHHSHDITAIDATKGEVVGTVEVGGDGEGAGVGKDGLIYVALEDKNEVCVFDPKTLQVKRRIPLEGITAPTGLAIDKQNDRVFVGGHNKAVQVLDAATGKMLATFPSGAGTDAADWDAKNGLAFISNGEGNITVIREKSPSEFVALDAIPTQPSAKTMAFDAKTGNLLLPAATVVVETAADPAQKPKRTITDGSFAVLVVGR